MRNIILVVHISLDGFVAGPNGELDNFPKGEENLEFVTSLTGDADAALFGRASYELLNSYWPTAYHRPEATTAEIAYSNWYNSAQKIVVSKTLPDEHSANTIIIRKDVTTTISQIKQQAGKDILIFGSPSLSQTLVQANLIDRFWIFINPVIFGRGLPLFRELPGKVGLKLQATKSFANGEVALSYGIG